MRKGSIAFFVISLLMVALGSVVCAEPSRVLNIRYWAAPDHTRIVLDVSGEVDYRLERAEGKAVLTVKGVVYPRTLKQRLALKKPGIESVSFRSLPDDVLDMEMVLSGSPVVNVFTLPEIEGIKPRIVVDVRCPELEMRKSKERERVKTEDVRRKIVIIDPGHGGDDPGAVGRYGTYEKHVVLSIARKLRDRINAKKDYRAFLTRDGDYYVSFKKRLEIAREYGADLFVSLHADASSSRRVAGASVYCLSVRGASSEAARILARKENLADIVGGAVNGRKVSEESEPIILNMVQTNTINTSKHFGNQLLKHLSRVHTIKYHTVQEAPFMVLKLPDIPSVLVETAFISNPREEKRLRSPRFQRELAATMAEAVVLYLEQEEKGPPTLVKLGKEEKDGSVPKVTPEKKVVFYKIKRGDRLEAVARAHGTTVAAISELNRIRDMNNILIGQTLKIPVPERGTEEKADKKASAKEEDKKIGKGKDAFVFHVVKKGETLESIAKKRETTIARLRELNHLGPNDPLLAGTKIKISKIEQSTKAEKKVERVKAFHVVKRGDTLDLIARRHGVSVASLKRANTGKHLEPLYVNQRLRIPDR